MPGCSHEPRWNATIVIVRKPGVGLWLAASVLAMGCGPAIVTIETPPGPKVPRLEEQPPRPPDPPEDDVGVMEECAPMILPWSATFLNNAAACHARTSPKWRKRVTEVRSRTCLEVRSGETQQLACERGLVQLFDIPDCTLDAATAIVKGGGLALLPPQTRRTRPTPCQANPPLGFEPDPRGPVEIVVKTEGAAIAGLRGVAVALSDALVLARSVAPGEAASGAVDLTLGRFRGRLDPGPHRLQVWSLSRNPGIHDTPATWMARCLTIQSGVPVTATVIISFPETSLGRLAGLQARVEVR
jgi:hypothetical protein